MTSDKRQVTNVNNECAYTIFKHSRPKVQTPQNSSAMVGAKLRLRRFPGAFVKRERPRALQTYLFQSVSAFGDFAANK